MSTISLDQTVYQHLHRLSSLDRARELFADLNYDPSGQRLTWPTDPGAAGLADDPRIIATRGDFQIIYSRLNSDDRLLIGKERPIVERLLRDHPYSLFLFSDVDYSHWHFVNVKYDEDGKRRRVHRRISVGPDERVASRLRTASEQLTEIALESDELDRLEQAPLEIQRRHDLAFDVEIVTKRFYQEYAATFELVEKSVRGISNSEQRRLFTQRLFNRLMFVAFIQRKGWLKLDGSTDYLNALWGAWERDPEPGGFSFYNRRLKNLFFTALDNPAGHDYMEDHNKSSYLRVVLGDVHYLNGGLFEKHDDDKTDDIDVPDESIKLILDNLFNSFNFTVTESTPLDVEVAVDPEMLGKVFEELVTGRHESGSYYTPKPIVSFMCREALKGYLSERLPNETHSGIEQLVDDYDPAEIHNPEAVLRALQEVTACDPACGSGAYLLGLLHELTEIRRSLFASRRVDPRSDYDRKLEIIQRNIYGVDIDPFATNIAKLRLWLSLAVDYDGDDPPPLPNLDFKIETGDSLLGRDVGAGQQLALRRKAVEDFQEYKALYMMSHGDDKRVLKAEVDKLQSQLGLWAHGGAEIEGFDWPVEFAEVFADGGFDIVLANPPYVRQELIKEIKPALKGVYGPLYVGTADLYVFFYYRALEILKSGGVLAFISSNKWFRANYGKKLRAHIAGTSSVLSITDFGDLPVFEAATAYPMIFLAQKGVNGHRETLFTEVESLDPPYPEVKELVLRTGSRLPPDAIHGERWLLFDEETVNVILTVERNSTPLGKYVDGHIFYGIKTGLTKAFVIDQATRDDLCAVDPKSDEIIKPVVIGRDIRPWKARNNGRWMIVTKIGTDIRRYPAVYEHLSKWKRDLQKRSDQGNHWWELRACTYYEEFDKPKIIYQRFQVKPAFALDREGTYINDAAYMIVLDDPYLLAVLNSSICWGEVTRYCTRIQNGYQLIWKNFENVAIPHAEPNERRAIECAVNDILTIDDEGVRQAREVEINERVARLYGFTFSQLAELEPSVGGEYS